MVMFKTKLEESVRQKKNPLCLGIDLHEGPFPPFFEEYKKAHGMRAFVKAWVSSLIEVSSEHLPAVKFQSSFFEALGGDIYSLLPELVSEASSKGLLTILDVKRCDIASTMKAYGKSAFEEIKADAMTVVPYMGLDVFRPLYEWMRKGHGVYSIFLSSNPSGFDKLSYLVEEGKMVAEHFHRELFSELEREGLKGALGLVVGSTSYPKKESSLSILSEEFPFLLPGLGFQGGEITESFSQLASPGKGHLFPLSRSLTAVGDPSLTEELSNLKDFKSYEEFLYYRIDSYKKAFLDLFPEIS